MSEPLTANFPLKVRDFESQILFFNGMYKLPIAPFPSSGAVTLDVINKNPNIKTDQEAILRRLVDFEQILKTELAEIENIMDKVNRGYPEIEILVDIADLLGAIQVYCASEMAKFGLPLKEILSIIMSSNFSKLGADGAPLYDSNGKVLKGPAYWKPEPSIKALLEERIAEATSHYSPVEITWTEEELKASKEEERKEGE